MGENAPLFSARMCDDTILALSLLHFCDWPKSLVCLHFTISPLSFFNITLRVYYMRHCSFTAIYYTYVTKKRKGKKAETVVGCGDIHATFSTSDGAPLCLQVFLLPPLLCRICRCPPMLCYKVECTYTSKQ